MANAQQRIVITATSTLTPVGGNTQQTLAAINAGIIPFKEHDYYDCIPADPEWDENAPLYAAIVPTMDILDDNHERFFGLAIPAITEIFNQAKLNRTSLNSTGLFLSLPIKDSVISALQLDAQWLPQLLKRLGLSRLTNVKMEFKGHAGFFYNLQVAKQLLLNGKLDACIVGGVDSHLLRDRVKLYDHHWRIKSSRNPDGFLPGEGACMVLLETEDNALQRGATPIAVVDEISCSMEPCTVSSDRNSTGKGLTESIEQVLVSTSASHQIQSIFGSLNGESYFAFEWGLILSRLGHLFTGNEALYHPADTCGEMGAALSPLLTICGAYDIESSSKEANVLVWSASEIGERCALLLKSV